MSVLYTKYFLVFYCSPQPDTIIPIFSLGIGPKTPAKTKHRR